MPLSPKKLGKYEIRKQIGRGSMGVVYQGYDPFMDKQVAVKVAMSDALKDKESGQRYRKMFFNEAHTAGMLKHPNIMGILDAGVDDEECYIVDFSIVHVITADTTRTMPSGFMGSPRYMSPEEVQEDAISQPDRFVFTGYCHV